MLLVAPAGATGSVLGRSGTVYTITPAGTLVVPNSSGDIVPLLNAGFQAVHGRLPWALGRFYAANPGDAFAAILTVAGVINAYPVYIPSRVQILTLAVLVTTLQASSTARVGIYNDNGGTPVGGSLIVDSGVLNTTSNAVITGTPANPPALDEGWYWFASTFASPGTLPSVSGVVAAMASGVTGNFGGDTAAHALAITAAGSISGVTSTFTPFAALPATFPSAGFAATVNATLPAIVAGV